MNRSRTTSTRTRRPVPGSSRAGFTLLEMLVSVTLVLIMMVMFAEVFQLAGNSVTKQRTLADNDQNARTFVTIMRADLDKRTFRTVIPFYPGEPHESATPFNNRRGYFYISNNNLGDATDDVLQFTVMSTVSTRNSDESPYYGAATQLPFPRPAAWTNLDGTVNAQGAYNFLQNPNQPDRDDGQIFPNGAASSRAAEVSYFMRGSRLYRRVMLIRDPIPAAGVDPLNPAQPMTVGGADYFVPANGFFAGNFWGQFDFSAYLVSPTLTGILPPGARFVGTDSLRNDLPAAFPSLSTYCYSLGQSWNRFGFNSQFVASNTANGLPREFSSATAPNFFIGRFTQEETSNLAFQYPQSASTVGNGNPMDAAPAGNALTDATNDGVVDQFAGGPRAGVDLLLSNVHEFRVEVWDERIGSFVGMGHSTGAGDFHTLRRRNTLYAPLGGANNVFDTWHPQFDRNVDGNLLNDPPPYRPLTYDPTSGLPGAFPAVGAGPPPPGPTRYWTPGQVYNVGDVVFPSVEDINGNGVLDAGEDGLLGFPNDGFLSTRRDEDAPPNGNGDNIFQVATEDTNGNLKRDRTSLPFEPFGSTFAYRCIRGGTASSDPYAEPTWSTTPGQVLRGRTEDLTGNPVIAPEPDWIADYNVRPLKAIRITVRYQHPTSQQMKQVSLVHSLRDTTSVP